MGDSGRATALKSKDVGVGNVQGREELSVGRCRWLLPPSVGLPGH